MSISNDEAVALVLRIYEKDDLTSEERQFLSELEVLSLSYSDLCYISDDCDDIFCDEFFGDVILNCLSCLTNLRELHLNGIPFSSFEGLSPLIYLQKLYVNYMEDEAWGCPHLQESDLREDQFISLEGLHCLTNLQILDLTGVPVRSLKGVERLSNLQTLDLSGTYISSLKELNGLTNLQTLCLSNTKISSLEGIDRLKKLRMLELNSTQIRSLDCLSSLIELEHLDISNTSIDHIPKCLVDRKLPFITNGLWGTTPGIYMYDVRLSEQPVSLFSQQRGLIEAYYKEEKDYKEEKERVNEAKVIFMGDGGVGKTYTIHRICNHGEAPKETQTTPGVSITQYKRDDKATINFWDFGGQEIMPSIHRCFMTERTFYVVVVSTRYDITKQARYWLKNVETFAPNTHVILAVNQWEGVADPGVDEACLKNEFKHNQIEVVKYNAKDSNSIESLEEKIDQEIENQTIVKMKFPRSWYKIIRILRESNKSYVSKAKYDKICEEADVLKESDSIRKWLLDLFNDLGVCFSYHKDARSDTELADYMILNPKWLTNAVYIIVTNGKCFAQYGRITRQGLSEVLKFPTIGVDKEIKYSEDELRYILQVMRKFRLSFDVGDDTEFIPSLLPNETPNDLRPYQYDRHIRCEIRYDFLPDVVVHRLMVDCAEELNFAKCWAKGLYVARNRKESKKLFAVCDMSKGDNVLYIDVYKIGTGEEQPQKFLRELLDMVKKITFEFRLKATTWICSNYKNKEISFQWSTLEMAFNERREKIDYTADGSLTPVNVQLLLGKIFDEQFEFERSVLSKNLKDEDIQLTDKYVPESNLNKSNQNDVRKNMPSNVIINGNGPVTVIADSQINSGRDTNFVNSYKSVPRPSKEEFEQFREELKKLVELNEDQKELLYDAVGVLIEKLENPEELQKQGKKFAKLTKLMGVGKTLLGVAAQSATISNFLMGLGIF